MNIAIVIYSKTGTTLRLAELIKDKLQIDGHAVQLTYLQTKEAIQENTALKTDFTFTNLPALDKADAILFGGPIWAFRPCPVLLAAMRKLGTQLKGKTVYPFITMGFPFAWMTGTGSLKTLRSMSGTFGARVLEGAILTGRKKGKNMRMESIAESIRKELK